MVTAANSTGLRASRAAGAALVLLIAAVTGLHWAWVRADQGVFPHADSYVYLASVQEALAILESRGAAGMAEAFSLLSYKGRPPLFPALTLPLAALLGATEDGVLAINLLFGVLLLVSTFALGRRCGGDRVGLLAALIVASYPPIVGLTRI